MPTKIRSNADPATRRAAGFKRCTWIAAVWVSQSVIWAASLGEAPGDSIQTGRGHEFVCADYLQGKVFIVGTNGQVVWQYDDAPKCNDVSVLPDGNILFNTAHGVKEVTRDKQVVFQYETQSEVHACQRLPNGNTFIAESHSGRLVEVNPAGQILKELSLLQTGEKGGHTYLRNARRLENGNYLVPHYALEVVREYDAQGRIVWETPARGWAHSVVRLANGNTVISCADHPGGARVFEVDTKGRSVWEVQSNELPGIELFFVAGIQRMPNGNTVLANYLGRNKFGQGPHLIEITPEKKIVWTFSDHRAMRTISNFQVLDAAPQDASPGGQR